MQETDITPEDIAKNKELAALSYLWLFSLIIFMARRDSAFIRWHARQGLTLFVFSILLWILPITRYGEFIILALMVLGFIEAAMGNVYRMPFIGPIADGTFSWNHVRKGWHVTKHTALKFADPEHITPEFQMELKSQEDELKKEQHILHAEEKMLELEEKKLSSLYHRVEEDEKKIRRLEDEVRELEGDRQSKPM